MIEIEKKKIGDKKSLEKSLWWRELYHSKQYEARRLRSHTRRRRSSNLLSSSYRLQNYFHQIKLIEDNNNRLPNTMLKTEENVDLEHSNSLRSLSTN